MNNQAFFVSHRLPIALAARQNNFDIELLTGQAGSKVMEDVAIKKIQEVGLVCHKINFTSSGVNPFIQLLGLIQTTARVYKTSPTLMHCASPKAILFGGIAARFCGVRGLVIAISGMGFLYTNRKKVPSYLELIIGKIYKLLFKFVLGHPNLRVIVQNQDDKNLIINLNVVKPDHVVLIPGSGVDLSKLIHVRIEDKEQIVLLPARMLWDKGVGEFVQAAAELKKMFPKWRFIMAGAADYDNPTSIPLDFLEQLNKEQIVEWVGHVEDMTPYFSQASIVCLPSYREGMPKCLLEGAAAGCAIVTTDVVGCRESIIPGLTGTLVPVEDVDSLKNELCLLINNRLKREEFGRAGRNLATNKFGINAVINKTLLIYEELCKDGS